MRYADHAATTPLRPEARAAMEPFLGDAFGNPSGMHAASRRAKHAIEDARERAAALLGAAHPLDVVFTGGGTESDNLGVAGPALAAGGRGGVVLSAVEHDAVHETARFLGRLGCPVTVVPVDDAGRVDPAAVAAAVGLETAVVSVMAANNETGVVQPVAAVAEAVAGVSGGRCPVHTDAVQWAVSRDAGLDALGADLITIASHKLGGPKGVGLLVMRPGIDLEPVIHGGGQEVGRRSGTHDVAGIVGMVAALEAAVADRARFAAVAGGARRRFEERLAAVAPDAVVTGSGVDRLVQHSHVRLPGADAETLVVRLDAAGIAVSAGSACHSGALTGSRVLAAMGWSPAEAAGAIRVSFGWTSDPGDGDAVAEAIGALVAVAR